jgi:hypothetical protein
MSMALGASASLAARHQGSFIAFMDTDHGADRIALGCGEPGIAQFTGAAILADPFSGGPRLARGIGEVDIAAKPDDVAEPQILEESKELMVAEAAVGEDRDRNPRRQDLRQSQETGVFMIIAPIPQLVLPYREP